MIWLLTAIVAYLGWVTHRQERRIDSLYVVRMVQQDIICNHKERLDALEDMPEPLDSSLLCVCGHTVLDHRTSTAECQNATDVGFCTCTQFEAD